MVGCLLINMTLYSSIWSLSADIPVCVLHHASRYVQSIDLHNYTHTTEMHRYVYMFYIPECCDVLTEVEKRSTGQILIHFVLYEHRYIHRALPLCLSTNTPHQLAICIYREIAEMVYRLACMGT